MDRVAQNVARFAIRRAVWGSYAVGAPFRLLLGRRPDASARPRGIPRPSSSRLEMPVRTRSSQMARGVGGRHGHRRPVRAAAPVSPTVGRAGLRAAPALPFWLGLHGRARRTPVAKTDRADGPDPAGSTWCPHFRRGEGSPPKWTPSPHGRAHAVARRGRELTDRSDPCRRALEEGEVPDLGRAELDAARDVVTHPAFGHRDRGVGFLVGLP
jgi:hypothetical protein